MNQVTKLPTAAEIDEEAAAWVWRLDGKESSAEHRQEFEAWLGRDARHRKAFSELGGVWSALDGLAEAKREEKIATFIADQRRVLEAPLQEIRVNRWRKVAPAALAASLLVAVGWVAWSQRLNEAQTLATAVGQQRTVTLADGSTLYLNTNTILETRLDRKLRRIHLVKGEALFKVARDKERPFLVQAGQTFVRAIGTEFNVRMLEANDIEVIVAEGRVEVESEAQAPATQLPTPAPRIRQAVNAGQRWEAAKPIPIIAMDDAAVAKTLAWRDGALIFDGEPLSQAIAELNRYTETRFVVTDSQVRNLKVGGRFKAGDVDGFLAALEKALPIAARRTPDNIVFIESRS